MGLIGKYGKHLVGKAFIWCGSYYTYTIGKIIRINKTGCMLDVDYHVLFKPACAAAVGGTSFFQNKSPMDKGSVLIENFPEFQKYLELFDGTN